MSKATSVTSPLQRHSFNLIRAKVYVGQDIGRFLAALEGDQPNYTATTDRLTAGGVAAVNDDVSTRHAVPILAAHDRFILAKALRLCRSWPFSFGDVDDVLQDLRIAWICSRDNFDPARGNVWSFLKTIVERSAGNLRRQALAQKRSAIVGTTDTNRTTVTSVLSPDDFSQDRRLGMNGQSPLCHEDRVQLRLDVAELIKILPARHARLCEALREWSIADISRATGVPTSTVSSRVSVIRQRWESSRLSQFL